MLKATCRQRDQPADKGTTLTTASTTQAGQAGQASGTPQDATSYNNYLLCAISTIYILSKSPWRMSIYSMIHIKRPMVSPRKLPPQPAWYLPLFLFLSLVCLAIDCFSLLFSHLRSDLNQLANRLFGESASVQSDLLIMWFLLLNTKDTSRTSWQFRISRYHRSDEV